MELSLEHIYKSFGDKQVLKDVSFTISSGQSLGLLGRNGAGKTTIIRIIMDIFKADRGSLLFHAKPLNHKKVKIGYLPEERGLYAKLNILQQMVYFARLKGINRTDASRRARDLLKQLEAEQYIDQKLETLSKGNQQKIQLAIALLNEPDILALDEPFSGLDPVNAQILKTLITEQVEKQKIVLFSSHQMASVEEFCQHICMIDNGSVVLDGNIRDIKRTYPRNQIRILPEGNRESLKEKFNQLPYVKSIDSNKNELLVTLQREAYKNQLLREISDYGLDAFYIREPSLEDIFIEKAGGL